MYGVFRDAVRRANEQGVTFTRLSFKSNEARSQVWFNKVANGVSGVNPPPPEIVGDIAKALEITREQCAALICDGWYGVRADEVSTRVGRLAPALDKLSDADAELVEQLVTRLVQAESSDSPKGRDGEH